MKMKSILLFLITITIISQAQPTEKQWSSYRGNNANGVYNNANLPEKWDATTDENILWKVEIPGLGLSSPVIWGDKLFITTAVSKVDSAGLAVGMFGSVNPVPDQSVHDWKVLCFNKNTGAKIWEKTSFTGVPKVKRHPKSTHANCTAATDGKFVVAFFGSEGLYCYDMDGNLRWKKDFGILKSVFFTMPNAEWEFASSPIIYDGVVIIQNDVLENSFIAAYDVKTGNELWKKNRDEYPGWCTPTIYKNGNKTCIALNGYKHRGGYDFKTGEEIWRMAGGGDIQIPTPVVGHGMVYFNSAHGKSSPVMAIKVDAAGDITLKDTATSNEYVAWSHPRGGSYMGTMLLVGDCLYNLGWNGVLICYNALTGEQLYSQKAGTGNSYTSSPVAADGKIYVGDDNGKIYTIQAGPEYKLLAENPLNDVFMTTPAITEGKIYFRTMHNLIAVGKK